jgi:hypothetical protein
MTCLFSLSKLTNFSFITTEEAVISFGRGETYALKMIVHTTCFCIFESAIGALKQTETIGIRPLWRMSFSISA